MQPIGHLRHSPGVRAGATLALAVGSYGISFGALSVASGLSPLQTCLLSLLLFTGGSQFALIGVIAGGGTPAAGFGAASLLGIRNAVYGMQINALLRPATWPARLGLAQLTIDESTAVALGQRDRTEQRRGFLTAGIGIYLFWNATTAAGALLGEAIGDPRAWGLDGAAVAAFLALLWPRLTGAEPWSVAVVCALVTAALVPHLPQGLPIVIAALVAITVSLIMRRRRPVPPETEN
ncbi:AzlC family ABC transporter permease [Naumannella halotolerans]|uniref:Putative branched-subunit amino acid permease n=1 Tax=Naumannella halotolerans TaxID=993414 RepID=A0A4R7J6S1_9ACTN|nr:AzlC family ABC transporter permease [Naumannella halotolerans]TDT32925.1 putative branched-subunit amino acid permease [Naumannella halotolerans]